MHHIHGMTVLHNLRCNKMTGPLALLLVMRQCCTGRLPCSPAD